MLRRNDVFRVLRIFPSCHRLTAAKPHRRRLNIRISCRGLSGVRTSFDGSKPLRTSIMQQTLIAKAGGRIAAFFAWTSSHSGRDCTRSIVSFLFDMDAA